MGFESHAIVELMGHAKIAGKVIEETVFGSPMMRVDVPKTTSREAYTKYYSAGSIYCFTPCDESTAQLAAESFDLPAISPYVVRLPESPVLTSKVAGAVIEDDYYPDRYDYEDDEDDYDHHADLDEDDYDDDPNEAIVPTATEVVATLTTREYDKALAAKRANELLAEPFVIFDTECTGLNGYSDEIIQIAIINQEGDALLDTYIKPVKSITNSQYHGITDETVKDAPIFPEVYPRIVAAMQDRRVLAYNYQFDGSMLDGNCHQHKLDRPKGVKGECVMELYAAFYGEWNDYHENYKWQKLNQAVARFELEFVGSEHNALNDAQMTLAVLKKMAEWYEDQPDTLKAQVASPPPATNIPF